MKGVAEQLRILITSRIHNCLYHSVCVTCRFESWKTLEKSWKGKKQRPWSYGWTLDFRQSRRTCAAVVQHQRCEETHTYVHCTRCSFGSKQQLLLPQQPFSCESFFAFCPWDTSRPCCCPRRPTATRPRPSEHNFEHILKQAPKALFRATHYFFKRVDALFPLIVSSQCWDVCRLFSHLHLRLPFGIQPLPNVPRLWRRAARSSPCGAVPVEAAL